MRCQEKIIEDANARPARSRMQAQTKGNEKLGWRKNRQTTAQGMQWLV
jgi:hypothetical protein